MRLAVGGWGRLVEETSRKKEEEEDAREPHGWVTIIVSANTFVSAFG